MILPPDPSHHGIRLDAYVEEDRADTENGEFFDIEPDTKVREKGCFRKGHAIIIPGWTER